MCHWSVEAQCTISWATLKRNAEAKCRCAHVAGVAWATRQMCAPTNFAASAAEDTTQQPTRAAHNNVCALSQTESGLGPFSPIDTEAMRRTRLKIATRKEGNNTDGSDCTSQVSLARGGSSQSNKYPHCQNIASQEVAFKLVWYNISTAEPTQRKPAAKTKSAATRRKLSQSKAQWETKSK